MTKDKHLSPGQKSVAGFTSRQPKFPTSRRRLEEFSIQMLRDNVGYLNAKSPTDQFLVLQGILGSSHPARTGMGRDLCNSQELRDVLVPPGFPKKTLGKQTKAAVGSAAESRQRCQQVELFTGEPGSGSGIRDWEFGTAPCSGTDRDRLLHPR